MCGICGIIDWNNKLTSEKREQQVTAMNQALLHRGPDEGGQFSNNTCTLAMRRLSIIGLDSGQQPIFDEARRKCIVFNGEIYNYKELKTELQDKGFSFKTDSDTEVLLHLYEAFGVDMLSMLKGMFCFCIYHIEQQYCFLARDPFGEKPLYYHFDNQIFSFSSEVKSLLENQYIERKLNQEALPYYFRTSLVPEPITLLEGVKTLPPGHFVKVSNRDLDIQKYFDPTYETPPTIKDEEEAIELVRPKLINAVRRQTVSDVPIGAFLSGGIDSSTVVSILQEQSHKPIQTFNVRFEDQAYDESKIARKVADFCGTDHHEITIPNLDFDEDIFWKIIDHVGLPFRDSSAIPSFLISQKIAEEVKVALSGDGGDELCGGYSSFDWYQKIVDLKKWPKSFRSLANSALGVGQQLPIANKLSLLRKLKRGVHTSLLTTEEIPLALNEFYKEDQIKALLNGKSRINKGSEKYSLLKRYPKEFHQWSPLRRIMYYRLVHTLPSNMLIKVDRMSMANSLEVRAPFLDADLFAVSTKLSDDLLMRNGTGKYLLRKIMEKSLPAEVFNHPKMGFNIPLYKYKNNAFTKLARRLLFDENPWPTLFPKEQLEAIYQLGINNNSDNARTTAFQSAHQLWMLMQLFGWAKRFKVQL
ncbi:MAG: asparagine synthase (glutamine-hydrolyzing) [Saprospiraceae bacterium]